MNNTAAGTYMVASLDENHTSHDPDIFVHIWKAGTRNGAKWYVKTWGAPRHHDGGYDPYYFHDFARDHDLAVQMAFNLLLGWKAEETRYSENSKPNGWIEFADSRG